MKLRELRKLLNNTDYILCRDVEYPKFRDYDYGEDRICVGSPYVHDIITWNTVTHKFKTALYHDGKFESGSELEWIFAKMHELADSGKLEEIASGNDELSDPIEVYTFRKNKIVKTFTERNEFGWPHHDNEGWLMYKNTSFRTEKECQEYAINDLLCGINILSENLLNQMDEMKKSMGYLVADAKALKSVYDSIKEGEMK